MNGFFIHPTRVTPSVYFDPNKGMMDIRGKSSPENPLNFFDRLFRGLDEIAASDAKEFRANFAFEYFNTSSSKCMFVFFRKLHEMHENGKKVQINWYYEEGDEDMFESGEDLSCFFDVPVNFVVINKIRTLGVEKNIENPQLVA